MGICGHEQIQLAIEYKDRATEDQQIGACLIYLGFVSKDQLDEAIHVQERLRSPRKYEQAMAQAELAKLGAASVTRLSHEVRSKTQEVKRKTTGEGHPAITREMTTIKSPKKIKPST